MKRRSSEEETLVEAETSKATGEVPYNLSVWFKVWPKSLSGETERVYTFQGLWPIPKQLRTAAAAVASATASAAGAGFTISKGILVSEKFGITYRSLRLLPRQINYIRKRQSKTETETRAETEKRIGYCHLGNYQDGKLTFEKSSVFQSSS